MNTLTFPRFIRMPKQDSERETLADKIRRITVEDSPPKRILFLEDNQGLADLLAYGIFPKFDVKVEQATSVEEAKRIMEDHPVAAAILDIRLNGAQSGVDFYRWISDRFPTTDVCFLTAHASTENQVEIESIGPARVFSKGRMADEAFVTTLLLQFGVNPR